MNKRISAGAWTLIAYASVGALAGLAGLSWAHAGGPGPGMPPLIRTDGPKNKTPNGTGGLPSYLWYTEVFLEDFTVVSTKYDAANEQVVWSLKAKKKVTISGYDALFQDADGVSWGEVEIQLDPSQTEFKKGAKVKVLLKMPDKEKLQEVSRVTIRKLKKD